MSEGISMLMEVAVQPGQEAEVRSLIAEVVAATRSNEPGTFRYEWSISPDGTACHLRETYADSAAVLTHLGTFAAHYMERFMRAVAPTRLTVYGVPSEALRAGLAPFQPTYMEAVDGFVR